MSYFDYVYKRLFPSGKYSSAGLADAVLRRSKHFLKRFNSWKASELCEEYLNELWQAYFLRKKGIDMNPQVLILETPRSNGFAISYQSSYNKYHFHYLFDYLADRVKKLDYRLVTSKVTMQERGENVETREMHYLKPKTDLTTPRPQRFGNVQIEFLSVNNQPSNIKLVANTYSDRSYQEPENFEQLAEYIFSADPETHP